MNYITILGLVAAACTTISFLPQVIKVWKTKSTKDISLGMFSLMTIGLFLWLYYGILTIQIPIILANAISFILALIILIFKLKYANKNCD